MTTTLSCTHWSPCRQAASLLGSKSDVREPPRIFPLKPIEILLEALPVEKLLARFANEILNFSGGHNLDIIHPIDLKSGMHLHGEQQVQGVVVVVATETWNIILVVYG